MLSGDWRAGLEPHLDEDLTKLAQLTLAQAEEHVIQEVESRLLGDESQGVIVVAHDGEHYALVLRHKELAPNEVVELGPMPHVWPA